MREPLYLKHGVWWCRIRNPAGGRAIRKTTGCKDRKAAVIRWRELERESVTGANPAANKTSLGDALDARISERRSAGRAEGTIHMHTVKARQLNRVLGADTALARIGAAEIDHFVKVRLADGAARTTIQKELVTLRGTLKLARRRREYPHDVASVMPLDFSAEYRPRTRALSESEIEKLLKALPVERAAIVALIVATSATYPSELARLERGDIDTKAWTVILRGTKRKSRHRIVPIVSYARPWVKLANDHLPFTKWTNIRRDLADACARAGIARCSPNDLRRTTATLLRARGVEPQLIAPVLGHVDSRMVERVYGRLDPKQLAHLLDGRIQQSKGYRRGTKPKDKPASAA
jgi:integrase